MGGRADLRPTEPVGKALAAFAADIIAEGHAVLDARDRADAATVHDFRKTMKRWRAFLRLLEPSLGEEAQRMRTAARDLARELSPARDAQSSLDALADLAESTDSLSGRTLAALRGRLEAVRRQAEAAALTAAMRMRMRELLDSADGALRQWPLADIRFAELVDGLTEHYRRARAAVPAEWPQADSEELHELRARVVVHRYQMELMQPLWPRLGKVWVAEAQRLRERLGTCQDLAVLGGLTDPRQPLARWGKRLGPLIAARQAAHVAAAARISARLFAEKPAAFRRRLMALWQGGRTAA